MSRVKRARAPLSSFLSSPSSSSPPPRASCASFHSVTVMHNLLPREFFSSSLSHRFRNDVHVVVVILGPPRRPRSRSGRFCSEDASSRIRFLSRFQHHHHHPMTFFFSLTFGTISEVFKRITLTKTLHSRAVGIIDTERTKKRNGRK